jgi:hypothetical protein
MAGGLFARLVPGIRCPRSRASISLRTSAGQVLHGRLGLYLQSLQLRLQRVELKLQRRELAQQRKEIARQATAIEANEAHARRDVFMKTVEIIVSHLNVICSRLSDTHYFAPPHYDGEWVQFAQGRKNIFFDRILTMRQWPGTTDQPKFSFVQIEKLYPDLRPVHEFCDQAEHLFNEAERCATDLRRLYENSSLGLVYLYFCEAIRRDPNVKHIAKDSLTQLKGRW